MITNNNKESTIAPEMLELYKLLDKYDATKLERFNTVLTMYRTNPKVLTEKE